MDSSGRFVRTLGRVQVAVLALFVAVLTLGSGCDTKVGNGIVSTSTFESLGLVESLDQEPIQVLSDKIDLLKSILPSEVVATLNKQQSESFPLGTLGLGSNTLSGKSTAGPTEDLTMPAVPGYPEIDVDLWKLLIASGQFLNQIVI